MVTALRPARSAPEDSLVKTRAQVLEERYDREIDQLIAAKLKKVNLAAPISPAARVKLRGIMKKYSKSPRPFRDCVSDNKTRFGPGRVEAVCATLVDQIKGNKNWRNDGANTSESDAVVDADVLLALDAISEIDLQEIFLEARALDEHGTVEATALLNVTGKSELERWGGGVEAIQLSEEA
jgi:hypothetical protein